METDVLNNNRVYLQGVVESTPEYNHTVFEEKFYSFNMRVPRLSGASDVLPILISEKLIAVNPIVVGNKLALRGQFRSHNRQMDGRSKLILSIFCREITEWKDEINPNTIELDGYLCKPPIYRTTPFSREICDMLMAVNRNYDKSDYIPCIAWGRNARFCENIPVGTEVKIIGRVQSREYEKKYEDGTVEKKVAYEVSVSSLEVANQENNENQEENTEVVENQEAI